MAIEKRNRANNCGLNRCVILSVVSLPTKRPSGNSSALLGQVSGDLGGCLSKAQRSLSFQNSRSEQRMVQIIEAAIKNYASVGIEKTSFDRIAKNCKITRPLVNHYFRSKRALFEMSVKHIRTGLQQRALDAIEEESEPQEQLRRYIESAFDWAEENPSHVLVWSLFYYYCGIDKKLRKLNTELVTMGHERLAHLLKDGVQQGVFKIKDPKRKAKAVQTFIVGMTIAARTENHGTTATRFRNDMTEECLRLVQETRH